MTLLHQELHFGNLHQVIPDEDYQSAIGLK